MSLLLRYGKTTSITNATHAQTVRISSGTISCKSAMLKSDVVLACKRSMSINGYQDLLSNISVASGKMASQQCREDPDEASARRRILFPKTFVFRLVRET